MPAEAFCLGGLRAASQRQALVKTGAPLSGIRRITGHADFKCRKTEFSSALLWSFALNALKYPNVFLAADDKGNLLLSWGAAERRLCRGGFRECVQLALGKDVPEREVQHGA